MSINVFCQHFRAEKKNVSALIVAKYSLCEGAKDQYAFNKGKYAFVRRDIILNDRMYYFIRSRTDEIIQENIYLLNDLGGTIDDYQHVFYFSKEHSIDNDLSICPFDSTFHIFCTLETYVYSKNGFFKKNDCSNDLYAVYCFEGDIILYTWEGSGPDGNVVKAEDNLEPIDNCGCPEYEGYNKYKQPFIILQKTNRVFPFYPEKWDMGCYQPTSINLIELYDCE